MLLHKGRLSLASKIRRYSTAVRRYIEDEGDWYYASEWWGKDCCSDGHTVFRSTSDKGNGVVSVLAYPSSRPDEVYWPATEEWLQQRHAMLYPGEDENVKFRVLGYQWRSLRFNDRTRQSTVKIMAASKESDPGSVLIMQQGHLLAVPYLKSMVSTGLSSLASCNFDLSSVMIGKKNMNILCIGHGGGSLPLFLACKFQGAVVHVVEIDALVISASVQAMGFPSFSVMAPSGGRLHSKPDPMNVMLWTGIHERLLLYESDAEKFITEKTNLYDLVFIDAYDGEDIFPHKLWDPHSPFLQALADQLHPEHGTVVVNLHSDTDTLNIDGSQSILPMGKYVSSVCQAYRDSLLGQNSYNGQGSGLAFTVSVPWVCNTSLVVCRGIGGAIDKLLSKALEVENVLNLPFSCMQYIKRGFTVVS